MVSFLGQERESSSLVRVLRLLSLTALNLVDTVQKVQADNTLRLLCPISQNRLPLCAPIRSHRTHSSRG